MRTAPVRPDLTQRLVASVGALLLRALIATLRVRIHDPHGTLQGTPGTTPFIYAFWHNRILSMTATFRHIYPRARGGILVLTSASKDGMWLGALASRLGMDSVRGSSSRRGAIAVRELMEKIAEGRDIAITPDGPRGPRYEVGPGIIYLAQKAGIPIIPMHARFGRHWRLRTWDGFSIPKPFSTLEIDAGAAEWIPEKLTEEEFEGERRKIESLLREHAE
jgi:lysophospholipid acyltransferase (LPLAT)-like uncharacterized protein